MGPVGEANGAASPLRLVTDLDMPPELGAPFDSAFEISAGQDSGLAFNAQQALWLRSLADGSLRRLPGTAGGTLPFWSPDSRSIGFFAEGRLQRLTLPDGAPSVLADAANPQGGAWGQNGFIVFAPATVGPLRQVAERGGPVADATRLDAAREERRGTRGRTTCLVTPASPTSPRVAARSMTAVRIGGGGARGGSNQWADGRADLSARRDRQASGARTPTCCRCTTGTCSAHRFDKEGEPSSGHPTRWCAACGRGCRCRRLARWCYVADPRVPNRPVWVDRGRHGRSRRQGTSVRPSTWACRGTGSAVAYSRSVEVGSAKGLWVHDLAQGATTRVPFDGEPDESVWSPDVRRLAVSWKLRGAEHEDVYVVELSGARPAASTAAGGSSSRWPLDWSPDGRFVLYAEVSPTTKYNVWVAPVEGGATPVAMRTWGARARTTAPASRPTAVPSPTRATRAASPGSTSHRFLRTRSRTVLVSAGGGNQPRWAPDGTRLYYVGSQSRPDGGRGQSR